MSDGHLKLEIAEKKKSFQKAEDPFFNWVVHH